MGSQPAVIHGDLRERIISDPKVILDDHRLMRALGLAETEAEQAEGNVVDLRGRIMDRLESRLDRLEETNRSVIAAAYEIIAGTKQVHRAALRMLEPTEFEDFLKVLGTEIAGILRVESMRLVLETHAAEQDACLNRVGEVLRTVPGGFVERYLSRGRPVPLRPVTLRPVGAEGRELHGDWAGSEACLLLNLGEGRLPGLLTMAVEDPHKFVPTHATDLLHFFGGAFERAMRRWLD